MQPTLISERQFLIASLIGFFVISTMLIVFSDPKSKTLFTNIPESISSGLASVLSLLVIYKQRRSFVKSGYTQFHLFLIFGIWLWFSAELIYSYYQIGLSTEVPFPSLADPVYLIGYAFFGTYLYGVVKKLNKSIEQDLIVLVSISATVSMAYILYMSLGVAQLITAEGDPLITTLSFAYPILDVLLLVPALVLLWTVRKGDLQHTHFIMISIFVMVSAIGDIGFGYSSILGTIEEEEWIWDIFYNGAYLTLAAAMFWQLRLHHYFQQSKCLQQNIASKDKNTAMFSVV